jgi:hypothetical protein
VAVLVGVGVGVVEAAVKAVWKQNQEGEWRLTFDGRRVASVTGYSGHHHGWLCGSQRLPLFLPGPKGLAAVKLDVVDAAAKRAQQLIAEQMTLLAALWALREEQAHD